MTTPDSGRLLAAWEEGQAQHPLHRALTLLHAGNPECSIDTLALLPIGERDRQLLELRRRIFGGRFDAVSTCPECSERLELTFDADALPGGDPCPQSIEVRADDRPIEVRLPTTVDLLDVAREPQERRAAALLARCTGVELPAASAEAVELQMAEIDPMTRIDLAQTCPACEFQWTDCFDIASYLWMELNDYALRLLRETHILAHAYGWREDVILALSTRRRQTYLDLVLGS